MNNLNNANGGRQGSRLKTILLLLTLLMLAACGGYYYVWKQAREAAWRHGENAAHYKSLRDTYLAHVNAGEHEQAYALTSLRFQRQVSRDQFATLAKRYIELDRQPESQYLGESVGQSGPPSGDPSGIGHQYMEFHRQFRYRDGKLITITLQIRRDPDSLLFLEPPEIKVDVFTIEEKTGNKQ